MTSLDPKEVVQRLFIKRIDEVRRFVTAMLPDLALADEAVEESFLAVTAEAHTYDPATSFTTWLHAILQRTIVEVGRRSAAESAPLSDEVVKVLDCCRNDNVPDAVRREFVEQCLAQLAPQARRILQLRYQKAMKPREVAHIIGWTGPSVHVALSRARAVLRECVDRKIAALSE
jgi:RNA polymerase sigma-70 factor (ECF subfamily)